MKNTFGSDLSLTIFGESHGRAIGAVLDGMSKTPKFSIPLFAGIAANQSNRKAYMVFGFTLGI